MTDIADDDFCFVCGHNNPDSMRAIIDMDRERKAASCRIVLDRKFQGWQEIVHGGILATMLDEVSAYAGKTVAKHVVTVEMTVRYKKPVRTGQEVLVTAEVVGQRKKIIEISSRLTVDGEVCTEADAKMYIVTAGPTDD